MRLVYAQFLPGQVVVPVLIDVAVAADGAEFEDGFGAVQSPAGAVMSMRSSTRCRQAPSMTPVAMGHPCCSAVG